MKKVILAYLDAKQKPKKIAKLMISLSEKLLKDVIY